jgi:hypothetical protein
MTALTKADAVLWARKAAWTCQAAAALIQGISPKGLEVARQRVQKSTSSRAQYEKRQEKLEDVIARVVSVMKVFEAYPPNGKTPLEWFTHAKSLNLDVNKVWDKLLAEEQPAACQKVGTGDTAKTSKETPAERRAALDITTMRGCPRLILEHWDEIESLHGPSADGRQVRNVLKRNLEKNDEGPSLKTIQNQLRKLRLKGLIP